MSTPRVAAVYCVYDDDRWLGASLESVYDAVEAVFFLVGNRPWNGPVTDNSSTLAAIRNFPDPAGKLSLIRGNWATETEQRNHGLDLLRGLNFQYCLVVDADEVYQTEQLRRMRALALAHPEVDCFHATVKVYWKSLRQRIEPPENFKPPVLVRADRARFAEHRNVACEKRGVVGEEICFCHHLSYARSDAEVQRKLASFSHSHELVSEWYQAVWCGWDLNPAMENLHPTCPANYRRAVSTTAEELPKPLRARWAGGL